MLYWELCDEQYEPNELEALEHSDHSLDRPCIRECKNCLEQNMCPEKKIDEEMMEDSEEYKKRYLTKENVDSDYCCWCPEQFKEIKDCSNCIANVLDSIN